MKRVISFAPHKTAVTVALVFAISSLIFILPMIGIFSLIPATDQDGNPIDAGFPLGLIVFMPVVYLIMGYLGTAFAAWVYNRVAKFTGGIQFELDEAE
jgi:hypothetical protein